jgi:hypothetical protein
MLCLPASPERRKTMRTPIVGLIAVALVAAMVLSPLTALAGDGDFVWAKQMGGPSTLSMIN